MFIPMHDLPLPTLQQHNTYGINAWIGEWMAQQSLSKETLI